MQGQTFLAIDLGTSSTKFVCGSLDREQQLHINYTTEVPTRGVRRGGITDMEEASKSIATGMDRMTQLLRQRLPEAIFSITSTQLESCNPRGAVAIPSDRDIDASDVSRVLDVAGAVPHDGSRIILTVMPRTYIVDGQDGIKNPVGMSGHRLEVEAHVVTSMAGVSRNLEKCAERANLQVQDLVVSSLASAEAVLAPSEREMGTVLIDIGGGICDIAIYADGGIWRTFTMPMGGNIITDDIAYVLHLPIPVAEELKITYGCATPGRISDKETIDLGQFLHACKDVVSRRTLAEIIYFRLEEMLGQIRDEILRSGRERVLAGGVVITGGTAELVGITEVAAAVFDVPVRIGAPHSLYGATDTIVRPAFATAVGLLRWHEHDLRNIAETTRQTWWQFLLSKLSRLIIGR